MELFLLSNGKLSGEAELLGYAKSQLLAMIARRGIKSAVFIPYALIRYDYDQRAQELAQTLGIEVTSIHHAASPAAAIAQAECILVSGGNTWLLNQMLHEQGLIVPIQRAVREREVPYVGWSAGCNVATPSIRTTNDMPVRCSVVLPALGLFRCRSTRITSTRLSAATWAKPVTSAWRSSARSTRVNRWWRCVKAACCTLKAMRCVTSALTGRASRCSATARRRANIRIRVRWPRWCRSTAAESHPQRAALTKLQQQP